MSIFSRLTKRTQQATPAPQAEVSAKGGSASGGKAESAKPAKVKSKTEAAVQTPKAAKPAASQVVSEFSARTLLAPLVTEKAAHLADMGVYAFKVPIRATRVAVGQAFHELYKVTPVKVNMIRLHGKEHRFGKVTSRRSDWKKALISLGQGQRVDIFEKL